MGIATGEVIVGTIGSAVSKSFTVIGDTVNVASRLVGANEVYGTRIIISEDTLRLAQQEVEARELDLITVVGRTVSVRIYELLGRTGELLSGEDELVHEFENGLKTYRAPSDLAIGPRLYTSNVFPKCEPIRRPPTGVASRVCSKNEPTSWRSWFSRGLTRISPIKTPIVSSNQRTKVTTPVFLNFVREIGRNSKEQKLW